MFLPICFDLAVILKLQCRLCCLRMEMCFTEIRRDYLLASPGNVSNTNRGTPSDLF